ncbi:hypothetical protein J6590_088339 [Homalodisca vitripennis]|nr:hypothetical protein J6590_088339 [Homalodisca vitripennis]
MSNNKDILTEATVGLTFRCAGSSVAGGLESGSVGPLGGVLLIGDSMLKYSGRGCALAGAEVDVNPGARIHNIKEKLIRTYVNNQPKVVFIHVGTKDLCKNYNGGEGYNGGWGKRAVLHTMADLLNVARHSFPNSLIMLSGVLLRNDISALAIANFNKQLALMCNNFGVLFVDANLWLLRRHLARDGRHLNRIGNGHFDVFILNRVREVLDVCEMPGGDRFHESVVAESPVEPTVSPSRSEGSAKRPENWDDGDRRSHETLKKIYTSRFLKLAAEADWDSILLKDDINDIVGCLSENVIKAGIDSARLLAANASCHLPQGELFS